MRTAWQKNRVVLFLVALTCCCIFHPGLASAEGWKAGVARVKITPRQLMWMAGYAARTHAADGSYADLWAKVLVLEDAVGQRGVLISLDLLGMDRTLSQSICRSLGEQYGLKRSQISLCFTHTHSGPVVGKNLEPLHYRQLDRPQQQLIDRYASQLAEDVVQCAGEALQGLRPCQMAWASGKATFAVNRRNNPAQEVRQLRADNALRGPVDHDVPVLAVRDEQGKLQAVAFGYACHATVLSDYKWSGDYPGFAALEIESRHAGCTALFWAGCGAADQNPLPRRELELAQEYGRQLAEAVSEVLAGDMQRITGPLRVACREIQLALDQLPTEQELKEDAASDNPYTRARAQMLLEHISRSGELPQTYPYPVAVWQLGDQIQFVFLGGEVVVDYALRLKSELAQQRTWVAGYCNDVMAYIPSERVLREGGYEGADAMVYYGLPSAWAAGVEQSVVDAARQMIPE